MTTDPLATLASMKVNDINGEYNREFHRLVLEMQDMADTFGDDTPARLDRWREDMRLLSERSDCPSPTSIREYFDYLREDE